MKRVRVIPILQLKGEGLVKTVRFKRPTYIGDPINAVKVFNEKEVDELVFNDIDATTKNQEPNYKKIEEIASECFMPLGYGGGIRTLDQIKALFQTGIEKVIINTSSYLNPKLIEDSSKIFGSQSIVVSVDYKKDIFGKVYPFIRSGTKKIKEDLFHYTKKIVDYGAGEIILYSIDKDGTFLGYDVQILQEISKNVDVPIVAAGGAGQLHHFKEAVTNGGASAVASGSMFVYKSKNKGILINYPSQEKLKEEVFRHIKQ